MSESTTPQEPIEALVKRDLSGWAQFIWNCTDGENYFRFGEYCDLIRTLDSYAYDLASSRAEIERLRKEDERKQTEGEMMADVINEQDKIIDRLRNAAQSLLKYFESGNSVPVERATIRADSEEVQALRTSLEREEKS